MTAVHPFSCRSRKPSKPIYNCQKAKQLTKSPSQNVIILFSANCNIYDNMFRINTSFPVLADTKACLLWPAYHSSALSTKRGRNTMDQVKKLSKPKQQCPRNLRNKSQNFSWQHPLPEFWCTISRIIDKLLFLF